VLGLSLLCAQAPAQQLSAGTLLTRHAELREQLADNPFQRPLIVESSDHDDQLKGEIYAQLEQPFAVIAPQLKTMAQWCDVLILHLNVKSCRPSSVNAVETLSIKIGRKFEQPLEDAHPFDFLYQVKSDQSDFLHVRLTATEGPLVTSDYNIELQLVALDEQRSFLHLYYLALEDYLGALSGTSVVRQEQRLNGWHSAVERFPLQLRELERSEYLAMKHMEIRRQQELLTEKPLP